MLTDIVRRVDRVRAGIADPITKHLSTATLAHIADYESHLLTKGRSAKHVSETVRIVGNVVATCRLKLLADLQSADDQIETFVAERKESGVSHRTVNADIAAIRAFCRWLVKRNRMARDPT